MFYNVVNKKTKEAALFMFYPPESQWPRDLFDVTKAVPEWIDWVENKIPTPYGFNGYENAIADQVDTVARLHAGGDELKEAQELYCKMLDEQETLMKQITDGEQIFEPIKRGVRCRICKTDNWLEYEQFWKCVRCGHVEFKKQEVS